MNGHVQQQQQPQRLCGEVWLIERRSWLGLYDQLHIQPCFMSLKPPVLCCFDYRTLLTPIISVNLQTELYAVEQTPVKKKKSNLQTATVSLRRQSPSTNNEPIITGKRSAILRQPVLEFVAGNTQLSDKWFHAIRECLVAYHGTAKSITFTNDAILRTQSVSSVPPAIPSLVAIIVIITRIIRRIKRKRLAATKIQNAFRNFLDRRNYLHLIRQRALVLEADIRRLRSRRMLKQLIRLAMHMRAKRQLILGELMETEQHYIDNMEITMRVFVKPMQLFANRLDLNEDKISRVYGNIEQVLTSHRQMLDRLREIAAQCGPGNTADIAIILALCSEICAWMPSVYSQYISNYGKSVSTLRQCRRNYEFRSFLESTRQVKALNLLDIGAFLIQPIQRLPRYRLMLKELLRFILPLRKDVIHQLQKSIRSIDNTVNSLP